MQSLRHIIFTLTILLSACSGEPRPSPTGATAPADPSLAPVFHLWAWQRPEDLSFIDPTDTKLALLTGSITLDGERMGVTPRENPVIYPDGTEVIAVIRLEASGQYGMETAGRLADTIIEISAPFNPVEYQIDFDARQTQREFYRLLLTQLRRRLDGRALSITALASWCFHDDWISGLPIDSAVAMLYRMGPETATIRQKLSSGGQFPVTICLHNAGYSTDEPLAPVKELQRIFLYHPLPWSERRFKEFTDEITGMLQESY
ncbi:MAG: hypothetical protein RQ899_00470 [Pseudomonadales bacterium]|nr:hypothetical protein [Pseudomonadales bacterium]